MKTYIVCLILGAGSLQPVFREDEYLMNFKTKKTAIAEIREMVNEVKEAVERGDMSDPYHMNDYKVIETILKGETLIIPLEDGIYHMNVKDEDWKPLFYY